jgi:hypothetical protein
VILDCRLCFLSGEETYLAGKSWGKHLQSPSADTLANNQQILLSIDLLALFP